MQVFIIFILFLGLIFSFLLGIFFNIILLLISLLSGILIIMIFNFILYKKLKLQLDNMSILNLEKNKLEEEIVSADLHPIIVAAKKRLGKK
mgnify:FL=1